MKKTFGLLFALFAVISSTALLTGCTVVDEDADPDTTVVTPSDPPDVNVTPPAGGSVEIDR
ncbi:MAG: hypothetical protein M3R13_10145 [Armatimonadota bacterium]|nr:hypothetical protein [Armatimonadota bacterium]